MMSLRSKTKDSSSSSRRPPVMVVLFMGMVTVTTVIYASTYLNQHAWDHDEDAKEMMAFLPVGAPNDPRNANRRSSAPGNETDRQQQQQQYQYSPPPYPPGWLEPHYSSTKEQTIFIVLTARTHFDKRAAIRQTWAQGHDNVYFVIGSDCPYPPDQRRHALTCEPRQEDDGTTTATNTPAAAIAENADYTKQLQHEAEMLRQEQLQFRDLIWTPEPEHYQGLPHKVKEAYAWIVHHLPDTKWIVKTDDDMYARVSRAGLYLQTKDATKFMVVGHIQHGSKVKKEGKWAEFNYAKSIYPSYPQGSYGHAVSRPVADYIATHKDTLFDYQGEDVSIGIWLEESPHKTLWVESSQFARTRTAAGKRRSCHDSDHVVIGHGISPEELRVCHQHDQQLLTMTEQTAVAVRQTPQMRTPAGWTDPHLTEEETIVIVMSSRDHFHQRTAIRETWAKERTNVYFVIGDDCPYPPNQRKDEYACELDPTHEATIDGAYTEQLRVESGVISQEQQTFRDLLWTPEPEMNRGLAFKTKEAYAWIVDTLPAAKWIVLVEDDMYTRVDKVEALLLPRDATKYVVLGRIQQNLAVADAGDGAEVGYTKSHYPTFPKGSHANAISRPVAEFIAANKNSLFEYQAEGVSIGIWMNESPYMMDVQWVETVQFVKTDKRGADMCQGSDFVVIGDEMEPDQMRLCHEIQLKVPAVESDTVESWSPAKATNDTTVIIVMSARGYFGKREAIRETWAKGHDNVYFAISMPCHVPRSQRRHELTCEGPTGNDEEYKKKVAEEQQALITEQAEFHDIIYVERPESYRGLVYKLKAAYAWVLGNTNADWVVKADDDTVVRVASIGKFLSQYSPTNPTVVGRIIYGSPVHKQGKWADMDYAPRQYPPWAQGSCGHVVSRPIVEYVVKNSDTLHEYQGEDTSLGIWLDESPFKQSVVWKNSKAFVNEGDCRNLSFLVIGHEISPAKMRACYKAGDESMLATQTHPPKEEYELGQSTPVDWAAPLITKEKTVIIVMTARSYVDKRKTIRETWAKGHDNVYFIVSEPCRVALKDKRNELICEGPRGDDVFQKQVEAEQKALLAEQEEFKDMIYTPKPESYRALVHKLKMAYSWVIQNTKADWIVKADDDTFVRVSSVGHVLSGYSSTEPTVVGRIIPNSRVAKGGKWADMDYKSFFYPPWPQGSCGHAVSRPVALYVADHQKELVEYQGEDSTLGIWLHESPIKDRVSWRNNAAFANEGDCHNLKLLVIGHEISPQKMRACFETGDEVTKD